MNIRKLVIDDGCFSTDGAEWDNCIVADRITLGIYPFVGVAFEVVLKSTKAIVYVPMTSVRYYFPEGNDAS